MRQLFRIVVSEVPEHLAGVGSRVLAAVVGASTLSLPDEPAQ